MNKLFYYVGLPLCFCTLVALTFLIPKTYKSSFVIAKAEEPRNDEGKVVNLYNSENYGLGIVPAKDGLSAEAYKEIVLSDPFLHKILDTHVQTTDGSFEGSYLEYQQNKTRKSIVSKIIKAIMPKPKEETKPKVVQDGDNAIVYWESIKMEQEKIDLEESLDITMDYETEFVTISCTTQDPLVSTMLAQSIHHQLEKYMDNYQSERRNIALEQLQALASQAKQDYEEATGIEEKAEKKVIYESFKRQEVIYKAQMLYQPSFTTIAEPTFSYKKCAPSRVKIPLIVTILLGLCMVGWDNKEKIRAYMKV